MHTVRSVTMNDLIVKRVAALMGSGASADLIVAAVLDELANDVPENYRTGVQGETRAWLRKRAKAIRSAHGREETSPRVSDLPAHNWE